MTYTDEQITDLIAEAEICADSERDVLGEDAYVAGLLDRLVAALRAEHQHRIDWANGGADRWVEYYQKQIDEAQAERDALRAAIQEARTLLAIGWIPVGSLRRPVPRTKEEPCPYTFSHTREFCGRKGCRKS